jgi:hypothetical protein
VCETFQALYSQVQEIKLSPNFDNSRHETTTVTIYLSSAPLVGDLPMKLSDTGYPITLAFDLQNNDTKRFLMSLRSRGLVSSVCLSNVSNSNLTGITSPEHNRVKQNQEKISKASSGTMLEFDTASQRVPPPSAKVRLFFQFHSAFAWSQLLRISRVRS